MSKIAIRQMILSDVHNKVIAKRKEHPQPAGNEVPKSSVGNTLPAGIERLKSYASIKYKNERLTEINWFLISFLLISVAVNILLWLWVIDLKDFIIFHDYFDHYPDADKVPPLTFETLDDITHGRN